MSPTTFDSVIATAVMAGIFTTTVAISGIFLGALIDRYPKRLVVPLSSLASLACYIIDWLCAYARIVC